MSVSEVQRRQAELDPKDDLAPYAGKWVALRKGHVIASDIDPLLLRDHEEVTAEDVIMPVPPSADYLIL